MTSESALIKDVVLRLQSPRAPDTMKLDLHEFKLDGAQAQPGLEGAEYMTARFSGVGSFANEDAGDTVRWLYFDQEVRDWIFEFTSSPESDVMCGPFKIAAFEYKGKADGEDALYAITLVSCGRTQSYQGHLAPLMFDWRRAPQPNTGWVPPDPDRAVRIVCAANRAFTEKGEQIIFAGARHCDSVMRTQFELLSEDDQLRYVTGADQGFIDQYGRFWNRRQAMQICEIEGQPVNYENQGGLRTILFSEGLY